MSFQYGLNTTRALWNYHNKKLLCANYPMIQDIEVTNACNLACPFCERDLIQKRGIGYMTTETFHNIVNMENKPLLRHTRLFMHGEPLLHPKIVDFVKEAKQYAKTVGFTTNAVLLNEDLAYKLLEAGLDNICISTHSPRITENIQTLLKARKEMNVQCKITLASIEPNETWILPQLKFEGIDAVTMLKLHDWGLHGKRVDVCLWPWWGLAVYYDGKVSPCCLSENSSLNLGNVNERGVLDLWNSVEYQKFRCDMLEGRACSTCCLSQSTFVDGFLRVRKPSQWMFFKGLWQLGKGGLLK